MTFDLNALADGSDRSAVRKATVEVAPLAAAVRRLEGVAIEHGPEEVRNRIAAALPILRGTTRADDLINISALSPATQSLARGIGAGQVTAEGLSAQMDDLRQRTGSGQSADYNVSPSQQLIDATQASIDASAQVRASFNEVARLFAIADKASDNLADAMPGDKKDVAPMGVGKSTVVDWIALVAASNEADANVANALEQLGRDIEEADRRARDVKLLAEQLRSAPQPHLPPTAQLGS